MFAVAVTLLAIALFALTVAVALIALVVVALALAGGDWMEYLKGSDPPSSASSSDSESTLAVRRDREEVQAEDAIDARSGSTSSS